MLGGARCGARVLTTSDWITRRSLLEEALDSFNDRIVQSLIDIGTRHDRSPAQVAIAWILDHDEISAPILGADLPEHVEEIFAGLEWSLPAEERQLLDEVSERPQPRKFA